MGSNPRRSGDDAGASLTGGGPSQVGVGGAMRARDVSRPHDEDLVRAEELVQISFRPRNLARSDRDQPPPTGGRSPVVS